MADFLAIGDNLALRYAPANITPPTGYGAMRGSTARPLNNIPNVPYVIVFPPEGTATLAPQWVDYEADYVVRFHYAKHSGNVPRDIAAMSAWLGVLLKATFGNMALDLEPTVRKAIPVSWQFTVESYGGDEYDCWDITVRVFAGESQAMAA